VEPGAVRPGGRAPPTRRAGPPGSPAGQGGRAKASLEVEAADPARAAAEARERARQAESSGWGIVRLFVPRVRTDNLTMPRDALGFRLGEREALRSRPVTVPLLDLRPVEGGVAAHVEALPAFHGNQREGVAAGARAEPPQLVGVRCA